MTRSLEKTLKKFTNNLNKGKSVFIITHNHEVGKLLGLTEEDINLDTLLIHKKVEGKSYLNGFINNVPITEISSSNYVFLDLEEVEFPEFYLYEEDPLSDNAEVLVDDRLEDFVSIFCEFVPYSILIYIFNTPYSQIGKKSLSAKNESLIHYFKHLFLNTLPDSERRAIQEFIYAERTEDFLEDSAL